MPPLGGLPESPLPFGRFRQDYSRLGSITSIETLASSQEVSEERAPVEYLPSSLSRTLLTSNLGTWDHRYQLRFSSIMEDNSSLAIFTSEKLDSKFGKSWERKPIQSQSMFKINHRLHNGLPRTKSPCIVRAIVKDKWQYKICKEAIIMWDAEWGVLLVDYRKLLADYNVQEKSKKNRKRVANIVKRYHRLEESVLRNETGGTWANYGDWDIFPATPAEVAQACRYEGHGFEEGLGTKPCKSKRYRIWRCIKDMKKAVRRVVSKH